MESAGTVEHTPVVVNGRDYVLAAARSGESVLVRTDGSQAGTLILQRFCVAPRCTGRPRLRAFGTRLLATTDGAAGEIYASEPGRERLTRRFGARSSKEHWRTFVSRGSIYVARSAGATSQDSWTLWRADLRHNTLVRVVRHRFGSPVDLMRTDNGMLLGAVDRKHPARKSLWAIRGGQATRIGAFGSGGPLLTKIAPDQYLFGGFDRDHGNEPWLTDGSKQGTRRLSDFAPGAADSTAESYVASDGRVYARISGAGGTRGRIIHVGADGAFSTLAEGAFYALTGAAGGRTIVRGDGTPEYLDLNSGTRTPIANVPVGTNALPVGARVIWSTRDELWTSDGTPNGSTRLRSFGYPGCNRCDPGISELAIVGDRAYFVADPGDLWATDGTDAGTVPLSRYATDRSRASQNVVRAPSERPTDQ
jgi:ELWxxDGT repeat protein